METNDILKLYKKYGVKASKRFGQNFLKDNEVIEKIIEKSCVKNKEVIEIGPGLCSLTKPLIKIVKNLEAYEIDEDMIKVIEGEIKANNFKLLKQDFLKSTFVWESKKDIVANIPYNITSLILFKIFKNINKFSSATIMIQKEVGERIIAKPNNKNYGKLSVTSQLLADIFKLVDVPNTSFIPIPKVNSVVLKMSFKKEIYDDHFFNFVKMCFLQQRKKLINNLKGIIDVNKLIYAFDQLNIDKNIRPQQLSPNIFYEIYKVIYNTNNDE